VWCDHFDHAGQPYQQKLFVWALLTGLRVITNTHDPLALAVLARVPQILVHVSSTRLATEGNEARACLPYFVEVDGVPSHLQTEKHRAQRLVNEDPVNALQLRAFALERLQEVERAVGSAKMAEIYAKVDTNTMAILNAQ